VPPRQRASVETRLLDEPFAEPLFRFFLRKRAAGAGFIQSALHLLQHVKVILDVFQRTVVGQLVQERFDLLLSCHGVLASRITFCGGVARAPSPGQEIQASTPPCTDADQTEP
jgi:hypothetical protein